MPGYIEKQKNVEIARACPECGQKLSIRRNRQTGHHFVGCTGWPECGYTEPDVPEDIKMRAAGQAEMFKEFTDIEDMERMLDNM